MIEGCLKASIIGRAVAEQRVTVNAVDLRDYTADRHRTVDSPPAGGGPGMVMKVDVVAEAVADLWGAESHVVLLTPQGTVFNQNKAAAFAEKKHLIVVCAHYEGIDERVRQTLIDEEISLGDYVLTNGSIAAPVVIDAAVRLLPGVLGSEESAPRDSFSNGCLLEYPQFTRPREFKGMKVPEVLLSGNHEKVAAWQRRQAYIRTLARRPDLLEKITETDE